MHSGNEPAGTDKPKAITAKGPRTKAEVREAKLSTLRLWKPGQSGNPAGGAHDTAKLHREFRQFMASPCDFAETGESNRVTLWRAMLLSAIQGDAVAQVALLERDLGKAPASPDEQRLALAGHFQRVGKDAAEVILACLGSRREKMSPVEVSEFLANVTVNVSSYLERADAAMVQQQSGHAQELQAVQPSDKEEPDAT